MAKIKNKADFSNTPNDSMIYDKTRSETPNIEELKQLSRKDKFLYFKEYFLPYIIIALVIILGLTWVIRSFREIGSRKDTFYCGMMTGVQFNEEVQENMPELFSSYLKDVGYDGYVEKDRTFFEVFYATYTDDVRMDGFYDKKRFDIFITRDKQFEPYASNHNIYDLTEVLPAQLLDSLSDRLVYVSIDGKESVPYGILLKDIAYDFYDGAGKPVDPPILSIPSNTTRLDVAIHFIRFITQQS